MFVNQHSAMEWGGHTENWVGLRKNAEFSLGRRAPAQASEQQSRQRKGCGRYGYQQEEPAPGIGLGFY